MKKRIALSVIMAAFSLSFCGGQVKNEKSLGSIFQTLRSIDPQPNLKLKYKKFNDFSFKEFKPFGIFTDSSTKFVEIGYDNDQVKEIIHHNTIVKGVTYKMKVFEFRDYRILLNTLQIENKRSFHFLPIAFIMMKNEPMNFLINVVPLYQVGDMPVKFGVEYPTFPLGQFSDISVIMRLDDELYPTNFIRLFNKRRVYEGDILYKKDTRIIDYESGGFFLSDPENINLKIDESTLLTMYFFDSKLSDIEVPLHPEVSKLTEGAPIWIFYGGHDYMK